jgi:beta-glucosidase-like glycosyl hydrolase
VSSLFRTSDEGIRYRDLNGNGVMDPYENPTLAAEERVADLLGRLSLAEKVGLMFQTVIEAGRDGTLIESSGAISKSATSTVVLQKYLNHFNVHQLPDARLSARWSNALQTLAEQTPHGIPVTVSTDPRHSFIENSGVSFAAGFLSQWPEPLGLAALGSADEVRQFADIMRREYLAIGIRAALHPTVDLATEPRWARQAGTFGQDSGTVTRLAEAYLDGLQGQEVGPTSVACTTKHFPGGGPQKDGEDAHFPYGREQVYPGGAFEKHLAPFRMAIEKGTAAIMPYYGMPVDLKIDGEAVESVGFGYNRQIVAGLLRGTLGYDGVVVTDWELVNDNHVGDQVLPARAWGVENLTPHERMLTIIEAGCDQFGGEECVDILLDLVADGRVKAERIDESARRLLRVKFQLGLFDDPFVDERAAMEIVGREDYARAGHNAQAASATVLQNNGALPLRAGTRVYVDGFAGDDHGDPVVREEELVLVTDPGDAEVAVVRVDAPWEHRDDLFLEAWFHQGSLEFAPETVARIAALSERLPVVIVVTLDRPAILTPLAATAAAMVGVYGASDRAVLDALTGRIAARGRLPFELPRSMPEVEASFPDVAGGTANPLFRFGHGIDL